VKAPCLSRLHVTCARLSLGLVGKAAGKVGVAAGTLHRHTHTLSIAAILLAQQPGRGRGCPYRLVRAFTVGPDIAGAVGELACAGIAGVAGAKAAACREIRFMSLMVTIRGTYTEGVPTRCV